jgi:hypothetical protein
LNHIEPVWTITPSTSDTNKTARIHVTFDRQDTADHSSPRAQMMRSSGQKPWKLGSWREDHPWAFSGDEPML